MVVSSKHSKRMNETAKASDKSDNHDRRQDIGIGSEAKILGF